MSRDEGVSSGGPLIGKLGFGASRIQFANGACLARFATRQLNKQRALRAQTEKSCKQGDTNGVKLDTQTSRATTKQGSRDLLMTGRQFACYLLSFASNFVFCALLFAFCRLCFVAPLLCSAFSAPQSNKSNNKQRGANLRQIQLAKNANLSLLCLRKDCRFATATRATKTNKTRSAQIAKIANCATKQRSKRAANEMTFRYFLLFLLLFRFCFA